MIFTESKKEIRVMFTPFRDGLQSVFGGKTRLHDILPAVEASAAAGIRHFEFGGGARFQAPFFSSRQFQGFRTLLAPSAAPAVDIGSLKLTINRSTSSIRWRPSTGSFCSPQLTDRTSVITGAAVSVTV